MKNFLFLFVVLTNLALASTLKAPNNFMVNQKQAVFVDFTTVTTEIIYNVSNSTATATTLIEFEMPIDGYVLFDLVPEVQKIDINGTPTSAQDISSPGKVTQYKMLGTKIKAGSHKMLITNTVSSLVKFTKDTVRSAFWMTDLNDRNYIEKYIPSNLEYDQYQLSLNIKLKGQQLLEHKVYTNGKLVKNARNSFSIVFPEYFTASSFYFHLAEIGAFKEVEFSYNSINGKTIPVIIYEKSKIFGQTLTKNQAETLKVLKELETKLGAWSHPSLTIYINGSGGMEYSGATMTSSSALGHEITHSFFARGVMPHRGNSGWIDEAIASWRDRGYPSIRSLNFSTTRMGAHSIYRRDTDRQAYSKGRDFMGMLNYRLSDQGGLISFLASFYKSYTHKVITTNIFKKELEAYSGINFSSEFDQYILGKSIWDLANNKSMEEKEVNPYHPKLTEKELYNLL